MKPDWDKLMADFADSKSSLVADVDCTTDGGKPLCESNAITGYPSIKYGEPGALKDYEGGRSYADFKKFADENLGPSCGPDNLDLCTDENKALIEKLMKMDVDELDVAIGEADGKIKKIDDKNAKAVKKLRADIAGLNKEIETKTKVNEASVAKETKKIGLSVMKKVAASRKKTEEL